MRFASPEFVILLLLLPLFSYLVQSRLGIRPAAIRYSVVSKVAAIRRRGERRRAGSVLRTLRILALLCMIVALMRPQSGDRSEEIRTEGIDIMLVLDTSTSMRAEDFKPHNRLYAAKQVVDDFIDGRSNDRIGLVVFAAKSFTQCPLTLDYGVLRTFLESVEIGMIEDGTAIGAAIANAINRLKASDAKSKIMILLTDGVNNRWEIDPMTAAKMAGEMGIKIYTIGAGTRGTALYPVDDPLFGKRYVRARVEIDEESLINISDATGGLYFRATDTESLSRIYDRISEMETTPIEMQVYTQYKELFPLFLLFALLLLILEQLLRATRFLRFP